MMTTKTILTCALTGSVTPPKKHLGLPITPKEIAESGIEAAKAGAAIVHIHVRDPEKGIPSMIRNCIGKWLIEFGMMAQT